MKTYPIFWCLLFCCTIVFIPSCKKAVENAIEDGLGGDKAVKVKVDGDQYESFTTNCDYTPSNGANTFATLSIASAALQGTNAADGVFLWFFIPDSLELAAQRYNFNDDACNSVMSVCGFLGYGTSINDLSAVSHVADGQATINITRLELEDGGEFKGTFSGTLIDEDNGTTFEFKDGEFDVEIDF